MALQINNHYSLYFPFTWQRLFMLGFMIFFISACQVKKHIPEGEKLYTGASIQVKANKKTHQRDKKELNYHLEETIYPQPNSKFLGLQPGLWAYYKMQQGDSGRVVRFLYKKYDKDKTVEEYRELFKIKTKRNEK